MFYLCKVYDILESCRTFMLLKATKLTTILTIKTLENMTTATNIKSIIFKKAWSIVKATKKTFSQALKESWAVLKRYSAGTFTSMYHFETEVLPFKLEASLNGLGYDGLIRQNRYKTGIEGWETDAVDSLVNFTGYVISVSSNWFKLFNAEQFKRDIDSLCLRIAGKKVTCKQEIDSPYMDGNVYKWAISPTSLDELLKIATKYKLKISLS